MVADFDDINACSSYRDCEVFCGSWQGCDCSAVNGINTYFFANGFINVDYIVFGIHNNSSIINIINSSIGSKIGCQSNITIYGNVAWILRVIIVPTLKMITIIRNSRTSYCRALFILAITCYCSH
ncbi:MAG: hypothetical protein AUK63_657 [bacterium P3]|nr:MAG: hypothetical protein AUK63_657 [bacterium P3]KWW42140.1 MAG: hypothetical protein F083_479 [bacterium F083]